MFVSVIFKKINTKNKASILLIQELLTSKETIHSREIVFCARTKPYIKAFSKKEASLKIPSIFNLKILFKLHRNNRNSAFSFQHQSKRFHTSILMLSCFFVLPNHKIKSLRIWMCVCVCMFVPHIYNNSINILFKYTMYVYLFILINYGLYQRSKNRRRQRMKYSCCKALNLSSADS